MMIPRPNPDEYGQFYAGYIGHVPEGAYIFELLAREPDDLRALLAGVTEEAASTRLNPTEWSIKEVLGHICDTERVLSYRATRVARGDTTPLPGFEQDDYVNNTNFNARPLADLLDEFEALRKANLLTFRPLTEAELLRRGTASNTPVTTRSLLYMLAGHVLHHVESLKVNYQRALAREKDSPF